MEAEKIRTPKSQATPLQDLLTYLDGLMKKSEIQNSELTKVLKDVLNLKKKKQISQPILNSIKKIADQNKDEKLIAIGTLDTFYKEVKEYIQAQKN